MYFINAEILAKLVKKITSPHKYLFELEIEEFKVTCIVKFNDSDNSDIVKYVINEKQVDETKTIAIVLSEKFVDFLKTVPITTIKNCDFCYNPETHEIIIETVSEKYFFKSISVTNIKKFNVYSKKHETSVFENSITTLNNLNTFFKTIGHNHDLYLTNTYFLSVSPTFSETSYLELNTFDSYQFSTSKVSLKLFKNTLSSFVDTNNIDTNLDLIVSKNYINLKSTLNIKLSNRQLISITYIYINKKQTTEQFINEVKTINFISNLIKSFDDISVRKYKHLKYSDFLRILEKVKNLKNKNFAVFFNDLFLNKEIFISVFRFLKTDSTICFLPDMNLVFLKSKAYNCMFTSLEKVINTNA